MLKYAFAYVIAPPMILRHIDAVPHSVCSSKVRSFGNSGTYVSENRVEEPIKTNTCNLLWHLMHSKILIKQWMKYVYILGTIYLFDLLFGAEWHSSYVSDRPGGTSPAENKMSCENNEII